MADAGPSGSLRRDRDDAPRQRIPAKLAQD
jgi:hypothetical protein